MLGSSKMYSNPPHPPPTRHASRVASAIARLRAHEPFQPVLREFAFAILIQTLKVRYHAFERARNPAHLARAPEVKGHLRFAGSPHEHLLEIVRQGFVGCLQVLLI